MSPAASEALTGAPPARATLLNGRVPYCQPGTGYRTGIEPVLLAASLPLAGGETVLEAGCGAGAGLLCAHARRGLAYGCGADIDAGLLGFARANFRASQAPCQAVRADIAALPFGPVFDHAMANPPWHDHRSTPSPDPMRARARIAPPGTLARWAQALAQCVRPGGTVSLILPAAQTAAAVAALQAAGCGRVRILPLLPRAGRPPRLALLQGKCATPPGAQHLPGFVLHDGPGYSAAAEAVLRHGSALPMDAAG